MLTKRFSCALWLFAVLAAKMVRMDLFETASLSVKNAAATRGTRLSGGDFAGLVFCVVQEVYFDTFFGVPVSRDLYDLAYGEYVRLLKP